MAYTYDGLIPNFSCWCSHSTKAKRNTNNGVEKLFSSSKSVKMTPNHKYHPTDAWLLASFLGSSKGRLFALDEIFGRYAGIRKLGLGNTELKVGLGKLKDDNFIIESEQDRFTFHINPSLEGTVPKSKNIFDSVDFFKALLGVGEENDMEYTEDELRLGDVRLTDEIINKARKKYSKRMSKVMRNFVKK